MKTENSETGLSKAEGGKRESGNANSEGKGVGLVELVPPVGMEGDRARLAGGQASGLKDGSVRGSRGRGTSRGRGRGRGGFPDTLRTELVEVLERYGVSVAGFDGLRSDSYEKHIASRSLAELAMVYSGLFRTSGPVEEVQAKLPRWSPEHKKHGDKPPALSTLMLIKERIRTEQSVREWRKAKGLIAARAEGGSHDDAREFYQEGMEILAEELLAAKVDGKPISENLKVVDRLLKAALLEVRERREARGEARLEWEKAGKPITKKADTNKKPNDGTISSTAQSINNHRDTEDTEKTIKEQQVFGNNGQKKAENGNKNSKGKGVGLVELVPPTMREATPPPMAEYFNTLDEDEPRWPLKAGDRAPETIIHTFDGERLMLSDYRGKYVLLDFWATWAGPSVVEKDWLKEIHQAYGQDERLVMISLSLDHDAKAAREHIKNHGYAWTQGWLGNWREDRVSLAWGVEAIPAVYLIGPEGKIVGINLRKERTRAAVEAELNKYKAESGKAESGNGVDSPEIASKESGVGRQELEREQKNKAGLVELVPPIEGVKDTRPEWAKRPGNKLIGGPSALHPKGIVRCDETGLPVDLVTEELVEDVDWTTLIGFGGDGEKALN